MVWGLGVGTSFGDLSASGNIILHRVFLKPFCRGQLPHKSVNLSFTVTNIKS